MQGEGGLESVDMMQGRGRGERGWHKSCGTALQLCRAILNINCLPLYACMYASFHKLTPAADIVGTLFCKVALLQTPIMLPLS